MTWHIAFLWQWEGNGVWKILQGSFGCQAKVYIHSYLFTLLVYSNPQLPKFPFLLIESRYLSISLLYEKEILIHILMEVKGQHIRGFQLSYCRWGIHQNKTLLYENEYRRRKHQFEGKGTFFPMTDFLGIIPECSQPPLNLSVDIIQHYLLQYMFFLFIIPSRYSFERNLYTLTHLRDKKKEKGGKKWKENINNKKKNETKLLAMIENIHLFYIHIYLTSRDASALMALALHIYSTNTAEI